nr:unnamed protein product [Naegleria fowleri]
MEAFIHQIRGVFVLDQNGKRLLSKYYSNDLKSNLRKQLDLEENVSNKTIKSKTPSSGECDIIMIDSFNIVFQNVQDIYFFVVGAGYENELVLSEVLSGLIDGLMMLFRNQLTKRTFLENFDLIVLALDEVLEDGIIIETDSSAIAQKVAAVETGADASSGVEGSETITQVFKSAREQLGELASSFFQF